MTERRKHGQEEKGAFGPPLARIVFRVSGIGPGDFEEGKVKDDEKLENLEKSLLEAGSSRFGTPQVNWKHVIEKIDSGEHKGFYVVTSGAIIVTIGIGLVRHGDDIKDILGVIRKHYKKSRE